MTSFSPARMVRLVEDGASREACALRLASRRSCASRSSSADRSDYISKSGFLLEFNPREQIFGVAFDSCSIVDATTLYNSMQLPDGEEPIVLHGSVVSGSGHFMVNTVASAEVHVISHLGLNAPAQFVENHHGQKLNAHHDRAVMLNKVRQSLT